MSGGSPGIKPTLEQSFHHLPTLLLFAVVAQECAEGPSCFPLNWQHLLQPREPEEKLAACICLLKFLMSHISTDIGGEDDEDAR